MSLGPYFKYNLRGRQSHSPPIWSTCRDVVISCLGVEIVRVFSSKDFETLNFVASRAGARLYHEAGLLDALYDKNMKEGR